MDNDMQRNDILGDGRSREELSELEKFQFMRPSIVKLRDTSGGMESELEAPPLMPGSILDEPKEAHG